MTDCRPVADLLAECRANTLESMRERDPVAKACLLAHVAVLRAELARRRGGK